MRSQGERETRVREKVRKREREVEGKKMSVSVCVCLWGGCIITGSGALHGSNPGDEEIKPP